MRNIYRQNEAATWGRGLTIERKFIGRTKRSHGGRQLTIESKSIGRTKRRSGHMGQMADHRAQIYRQSEAVTWGRGLTIESIESKSVGRTKRSHGAEGCP